MLRSMGVDHALNHAALFGFDPDELPNNLSLALGSGAVTPMQMAKAYSILANGGYRVEPYFIERIEDSQSEPLYQADPLRVCETCEESDQTQMEPDAEAQTGKAGKVAPRVISAQNHYLMNSMMRDVVRSGTAVKAKALGRNDLAGKTGTTNDQKDAWFNGFTRSLVAVSWVGFDSAAPLGRGEVGGKAALPAWMTYMREALNEVPEIPLKMPAGIVTVRIDPQTGKRAGAKQQDAIFEVFRTENAPPELLGSAASTSGDNTDIGAAGGEQDPF